MPPSPVPINQSSTLVALFFLWQLVDIWYTAHTCLTTSFSETFMGILYSPIKIYFHSATGCTTEKAVIALRYSSSIVCYWYGNIDPLGLFMKLRACVRSLAVLYQIKVWEMSRPAHFGLVISLFQPSAPILKRSHSMYK